MLQSVVNEHDIQSGTIYFERHGDSTSMAAYIKQPAEKTVFFDGSTLTLLQPEIKQETLFSAGSNRGQYESFLTLGFGGSGKDLQSNWTVSCQGMESIDGMQTAKLDLKPKQQSVANMFSHVTVWIDPTRSLGPEADFLRAIRGQPHRDLHRHQIQHENSRGHVQAEGQRLHHHPEVADACSRVAAAAQAQAAPARMQSMGNTSIVYRASGASMVASSRLRSTQ